MRRDIARALNQAERNARINPRVDTSRMSSQAGAAGRDFGSRFGAAAKTAIAAAGIGVGIAGIASQFKQVMSVGMDWTNNMNTLRAVTGGTADELKKAADAARALGNDITLPATSANDAASAMTELAKGGFTVQQAMDAAKGSLQLAAAAQISATDAATIQSQALQAFGLNASSAGKMSDTLANAANASSAEITDVAYALQAAGTVANQFGLSAEDTAAAIGLLANNGIKGSDAGTLLKSSLLALTDQGNPAQGAIKELGLTVYDAAGKFVGLHSLYGQLGEAAKRMTPEQYQAATAVLFGSDAMRIAGVAAKDGSASYDQMRTAIDKQGAAADVAAAKTEGMPGALERVKNAMESLQLKTYDVLQGPVSGILDKVSSGIGTLEDKAVSAGPKLAAVWKQVSSNQFIQSTWTDMIGAFQSLSATAQSLWPAIVQMGEALTKASAALGVSTWKLFVVALQSAANVLNVVDPLIQGIGGFMADHQGVVTAAVGAWLLFRTVPAILGKVTGATVPLTQSLSRMGQQITGQTGALVPLRSRLTAIAGDYRNIGTAAQNNGQHLSSFNRLMTAVSNNSPTIRNMGNAFMGASTNAGAFAGALRAGVQPALSGIKSAASGVVGALGGPFSVALIAATAGIALIASSAGEAKRRTRELAEAQGELTATTKEMYDLLAKTGGSTDSNVIAKATQQFDVLQKKFDTLRSGASIGDWLRGVGSDMFGLGDFDIGDAVDKQHTAEKIERIKSTMQELGVTSQSMGVLISGSNEAWSIFANTMQSAGDGGRELLAEMEPLRREFLDNQSAAQSLTPGLVSVRDAISTIANAASSAEDKTSAFKTALDALAGVQPNVQEATDRYNTTIRQTAQAAAEVADASKGMGQQLIGADGSVNTATENGHALFESLKNIRSATEGVAGAGGDLKSALAQNDQQLSALASKFGLTKEQVDAMAAAMGYVPSTIETLFEMRGADDATQQLGLVEALLKKVPPNTPIQVDAASVDKAREDLIKMGAKLEEVEVNGHKQLKITAPNAQVLSDIQAVIDKVKQVPNTFTMNADVVLRSRSSEGTAAFPGDTTGRRADGAIVPFGAIVPMADGGLQWIEKPRTAGIYAGRGAGTIFAEEETGGEAYIPLAKSKRGRSMAILMEVARLFGIGRNAEGSITVDELKSYASGISGGSYVRGGPPGLTGTDCSGAQAALANYITGAGGRFATGNESQALLARGFQQGDPPSGIAAYWIGWKNGGPGGGHTAGTILDPEGGNVNVEMGGKSGGGAFGGAAAGASEFPNRAWIPLAGYGEDPNSSSGGTSAAVRSASASVTSAKASTASAQNALDKANADLDALKAKGASADKLTAAEKKRDVAEQKLTAAQERQSAAETRLSEVKDKEASKAEKDTGAQGFGQQLASGLFGGVMESIGLPGFSNMLEWPLLKSGQSLLNAFAGPLKGAMEGKLGIQQPGWSPGMPIGEEGNVVGLPGGGGELPGISLPGVGDFLKPMPDAGRQLRPNEAHQGSGAAPGTVNNTTFNLNGGYDAKSAFQSASKKQNESYRGTLGGVRPV